MKRHGNESGDSAFEAFRREKVQRRRQSKAGSSQPDVSLPPEATLRSLEEDEAREARELRLRREIFDFVRDTTKVAAGVLGNVEEEQREVVSRQISDEMREFFQATMWGTEDLIAVLESKYGPGVMRLSPGELEAHMAALSVDDMDRYRAEGSAEAARRHQGSAPGQDMAAEATDDEPEATPGDAPFTVLGEDDLAPNIGESTDMLAPEAEAPGEDPLGIETGILALAGDEGEMGLVPAAFARLLDDPETRKKTLAILVHHGLLTKAEAREIFVKACPARPSSTDA